MKVIYDYSHKDGEAIIFEEYDELYDEILEVISSVDSDIHKTKISKEKTMPGKKLYSPKTLNVKFKEEFKARGWKYDVRIAAHLPAYSYSGFRAMDYVKEKLGVEVQFGKYSFMVYNVAAKMTIFHNQGIIDVGVEIVPVKRFAQEMSTGVSYFEQFVWDLEHRGEADIDIPVLVLGIGTDD
ncbi:hypothetical protein ES702_04854 [subsurface metagenome]